MNKLSLIGMFVTLFINSILAHQSLAIAEEFPSVLTATCHVNKYQMKPEDTEWIVDQGTYFYEDKIDLARHDRRQAFGSIIPSWVGTKIIDLKDSYALGVTISFMKNGIIGDFEQPDPAIALDAKLFYGLEAKHVLSSTTASGSVLDADMSYVGVSATVNDAELETLLTNAKITIPSLLDYGSGFRYWAAIRDHFGDALNVTLFEDLLKPLGRHSNLIVPSVTVVCNVKRPGM